MIITKKEIMQELLITTEDSPEEVKLKADVLGNLVHAVGEIAALDSEAASVVKVLIMETIIPALDARIAGDKIPADVFC